MTYFVVDAFTDTPFGGNPAGVCMMGAWPPDSMMQSIAAENNLAETAFLVWRDGFYELRWFTPVMEVDLCGHATIGAAFALFEGPNRYNDELRFMTRSGELNVTRGEGGMLLMDLPSRPGVPCAEYPSIAKALGVNGETYKSADILVVLDSADEVLGVMPDFELLKAVKAEANMPGDNFGVIITAPGEDCDFVSRFFAPCAGINEDHVTGSAHCMLTPYWSKRLGKTQMTARQLSKRGGRLWCEDKGDRVVIGGHARLYLTGEIYAV